MRSFILPLEVLFLFLDLSFLTGWLIHVLASLPLFDQILNVVLQRIAAIRVMTLASVVPTVFVSSLTRSVRERVGELNLPEFCIHAVGEDPRPSFIELGVMLVAALSRLFRPGPRLISLLSDIEVKFQEWMS